MTVYRLIAGAEVHPYSPDAWAVMCSVPSVSNHRELAAYLEEVEAPPGRYSLAPRHWYITHPEGVQ